MDSAAARSFADSWVEAWNAHDLDAVLSHFTDDAVFTSPVAARVVDGSGGVLTGKEQIRAYWSLALTKIPDLRFTLEGVYAGVDTVVIHYRNHTGALVCEVLRLADGLVVRGDGTYASDDAAGVSGVRA